MGNVTVDCAYSLGPSSLNVTLWERWNQPAKITPINRQLCMLALHTHKEIGTVLQTWEPLHIDGRRPGGGGGGGGDRTNHLFSSSNTLGIRPTMKIFRTWKEGTRLVRSTCQCMCFQDVGLQHSEYPFLAPLLKASWELEEPNTFCARCVICDSSGTSERAVICNASPRYRRGTFTRVPTCIFQRKR